MFDLEQAIADWRKQMPAAGIQTSVLLEELESHLRDDIDRQIQSGLNPQKAFAIAVEQLGGANILKNEFVKAGIPVREVLRRFILTLAGLPNHQLAPNMNTNVLDTEPRWATYAKAGTFLFPAVFLWLFTVVFVLPKVNEICQAAGTMIFNFSTAPAIFRASATIGQVMVFLTAHCIFIGGAVALAFVLLERCFSQ